MEPAVVLVSGAPGAGKTSLAGPLSLELGLPLIAKDVIKERMVANGWRGRDGGAVGLRDQALRQAGARPADWHRRLTRTTGVARNGQTPQRSGIA